MMMKLKLMVISKKPSTAKQRACGVRSQDEVWGSGQPPQPTEAHQPPGPSHQDFRGGPCRFLLSGHDPEVEDGREDENEAWGGCGSCKEKGMAIAARSHVWAEIQGCDLQ